MTEREIEDIFLDNALEVNQLWEALGDLVYIQVNSAMGLDFRNKEAKRKFGMALARLRLIKPRRQHGKSRRKTHS